MSKGTWRGESRVRVRWENRRCIWWVLKGGLELLGYGLGSVSKAYCCIFYKMGVIGVLIVVSIMVRVFGRMKVWCGELDGY